jgi:uncharacterized protein
VLIIVPPSETKAPAPDRGRPVEMGELSFPELTPARQRVAAALIETSGDLDAFERLGVRHTFAADVARNTRLFEVPAIPVLQVYTGPLHRGLDAAGLSPAAAARANRSLVVVSPLWGLLRPTDRVPPYRLGPYVTLLGIGRVDHFWRRSLPKALAAAAGARGVIVDLRTAPTLSAGTPAGLGDRTVNLGVHEGPPGHRIGAVLAKQVRGEAAHHLLESGADPADQQELADALADRWPVRLQAPDRRGKPWTMTLRID